MARYRYLKEAFWENSEKTKLKCIRLTSLPNNKEKKDVLSLDKTLPNGSPNPTFKEAVDEITVRAIDKYTQERQDKNKNTKTDSEAKSEVKKNHQQKKNELESLFTQKLQAFEIEEIKNCEDKKLRARLRRSKTTTELSAVAALIIGIEMGIIKNV